MSFSAEWDQRYKENTHLSIWPWSDLVSLVRRHCRQLEGARVLELGCGAGANIPFFQSLGVQYHAMEGSGSMVRRLRDRFPALAPTIAAADFTAEQVFAPGFDLIVDRASLTHNSTSAIENSLRLTWKALKPGAYFIGVDWFSTKYSEFERGDEDVDKYTRTNYADGPFAGVGRVHFSDLAHLRALFSRFEVILIEEKIIQRAVPESKGQFASWNIVVRKPNV
jgi:SAM-dependent methyltransferase